MTKLKPFLLAGGLLAVAGSHAAMAAPTIQYEAFVNGVQVVAPSDTTTMSGLINVFVPNAALVAPVGFGAMSMTVQGVGLLVSPGLNSNGSVTSSTTFSGTETLQVRVTQTGLTSPTGRFNLMNTLTTNNLGGSVASSLSSYIDLNNGAFAETTLIATMTNPGGTSTSNGTGAVMTVNPGSNPFSETQDFFATFTRASDTVTFSDQIAAQIVPAAVPEPASLALIGTALFGLGLARRRRT